MAVDHVTEILLSKGLDPRILFCHERMYMVSRKTDGSEFTDCRKKKTPGIRGTKKTGGGRYSRTLGKELDREQTTFYRKLRNSLFRTVHLKT